MTPEEELQKTALEILIELKKEILINLNNELILNTLTNERRTALKYLSKLRAIEISRYGSAGTSLLEISCEMNGLKYEPKAYRVRVLQPKFNKSYNNLNIKLKKQNNNKDNREKVNPIIKQDAPTCFTKKGWGYLQLANSNEKIKIYRKNSQAFRLLRLLVANFGTALSVEMAFDAIREGKHSKEKGIYTEALDKKRKVQLIKNSAIKELQKENRLRGKLKIYFDELENRIWINYVD